MDPPSHQDEPTKKPPVVRGARACTVCRAAKMKCVGSEDATKPCQRCKRANAECVFEKHRRGRKPGSKLSEASKMLRRLEKGLSTAKLKSQANDASLSLPYLPTDSRTSSSDPPQYQGEGGPPSSFSNNELPPLLIYNCRDPQYASSADDDDDDCDPEPEELYPAKLIRKENNRNSFFQTILNPQNESPSSGSMSQPDSHSSPIQSQQPRLLPLSHGSSLDPISAGIMDENQAQVLWDLVFLRLNPFINLFDPALHSVNYVRTKCRFLFTTLLMAGAKFFKPECYRACQNLANEHAVRGFSEGWKSVEVVQAFACLTYWKEPDDTRTWTYIGYACRMAVELGLNKCASHRNQRETEYQLRERRNRERTYLVLFVHDRSLSMQTGRQWMLPEDELVKRSGTWHEGVSPIRPEDVILSALVHLRRIAAETMETTDAFCLHRGSSNSVQTDVNYEVLLRNCNVKLTQWQESWQREMMRAKGESFHHAFLNFFRLYVRLFLNSFGIQSYMGGVSNGSPSLQALSACYSSALENLQIISKDFAVMNVLRYGQDSITTMSAYCAIFLLKLLRSSHTQAELHPGATNEIYTVITQTADAYQEASQLCPASGSAAHHARFLRGLVANDITRTKQNQGVQDSTRGSWSTNGSRSGKPHPAPTYSPSRQQGSQQQHAPSYHQFPATLPHYPSTAIMPPESYGVQDPQSMSNSACSGYSPTLSMVADSDVSYSRNLLKELGLEEGYSSPNAVMDLNAFHIGNGYSGFTATSGQQFVPAAGLSYVR